MNFITDFHKSRSGKIGSSDISACLQHPENTGSIAGYERTAMTVYKEKRKEIEIEPAGLPAKIGNFIEPFILKTYIEENCDTKTAESFYRGYMLCELDKSDGRYPTAPDTQTTNFLHHTEAVNDYAVAHIDCLHVCEYRQNIEAKYSTFWPARRRDDIYSGYDFGLDGFQGIPLKHYIQTQFQNAVYNEVCKIKFDNAVLTLLHEGKLYKWTIQNNLKMQERLLETAYYMKKCIDTGTPPKKLAMNMKDIKILYPKIKEDFKMVSGAELYDTLGAVKKQREASRQIKAWTQKKEDAENTLSIILKDSKMLKGIVDGEIVDLAGWQEREGGQRVAGFSEIKKHPEILTLLQEKDLIKTGKDVKFVSVKYREA